MIERSHLDLPSVRKEIRRVHEGRRTEWAVSEKQTGLFADSHEVSLEFLANTAEAADSSPGIPAILRQRFTNLLFRNLSRGRGPSLVPQRHHGIDPRCLPSWFQPSSYSDGYEYACGAGHSCRVIRAQAEEQAAERVNAE